MNRGSNRLKDVKKRILDDDARLRRAKKALESLEHDNYHEDPHADLVLNKKIPKFSETFEQTRKRRKKTRDEKPRFRKNFVQLLEEEKCSAPNPPNYSSAQAPSSKFPCRHFCAVCGFFSNYNCISCGAKYCSIKCYGVHCDTRCLKWTV